MFPEDIKTSAQTVIDLATRAGVTIAVAESCTGGLVAAALTGIPGSSAAFDRGFVTYSNLAKQQMLKVPADLIAEHGAVSSAVARAMAEGALSEAGAGLAVSITGVAGPAGGSALKPVGLVYFGLARADAASSTYEERFGDLRRDGVRLASVRVALTLMLEALSGPA